MLVSNHKQRRQQAKQVHFLNKLAFPSLLAPNNPFNLKGLATPTLKTPSNVLATQQKALLQPTSPGAKSPLPAPHPQNQPVPLPASSQKPLGADLAAQSEQIAKTLTPTKHASRIFLGVQTPVYASTLRNLGGLAQSPYANALKKLAGIVKTAEPLPNSSPLTGFHPATPPVAPTAPVAPPLPLPTAHPVSLPESGSASTIVPPASPTLPDPNKPLPGSPLPYDNPQSNEYGERVRKVLFESKATPEQIDHWTNYLRNNNSQYENSPVDTLIYKLERNYRNQFLRPDQEVSGSPQLTPQLQTYQNQLNNSLRGLYGYPANYRPPAQPYSFALPNTENGEVSSPFRYFRGNMQEHLGNLANTTYEDYLKRYPDTQLTPSSYFEQRESLLGSRGSRYYQNTELYNRFLTGGDNTRGDFYDDPGLGQRVMKGLLPGWNNLNPAQRTAWLDRLPAMDRYSLFHTLNNTVQKNSTNSANPPTTETQQAYQMAAAIAQHRDQMLNAKNKAFPDKDNNTVFQQLKTERSIAQGGAGTGQAAPTGTALGSWTTDQKNLYGSLPTGLKNELTAYLSQVHRNYVAEHPFIPQYQPAWGSTLADRAVLATGGFVGRPVINTLGRLGNYETTGGDRNSYFTGGFNDTSALADQIIASQDPRFRRGETAYIPDSQNPEYHVHGLRGLATGEGALDLAQTAAQVLLPVSGFGRTAATRAALGELGAAGPGLTGRLIQSGLQSGLREVGTGIGGGLGQATVEDKVSPENRGWARMLGNIGGGITGGMFTSALQKPILGNEAAMRAGLAQAEQDAALLKVRQGHDIMGTTGPVVQDVNRRLQGFGQAVKLNEQAQAQKSLTALLDPKNVEAEAAKRVQATPNLTLEQAREAALRDLNQQANPLRKTLGMPEVPASGVLPPRTWGQYLGQGAYQGLKVLTDPLGTATNLGVRGANALQRSMQSNWGNVGGLLGRVPQGLAYLAKGIAYPIRLLSGGAASRSLLNWMGQARTGATSGYLSRAWNPPLPAITPATTGVGKFLQNINTPAARIPIDVGLGTALAIGTHKDPMSVWFNQPIAAGKNIGSYLQAAGPYLPGMGYLGSMAHMHMDDKGTWISDTTKQPIPIQNPWQHNLNAASHLYSDIVDPIDRRLGSTAMHEGLGTAIENELGYGWQALGRAVTGVGDTGATTFSGQEMAPGQAAEAFNQRIENDPQVKAERAKWFAAQANKDPNTEKGQYRLSDWLNPATYNTDYARLRDQRAVAYKNYQQQLSGMPIRPGLDPKDFNAFRTAIINDDPQAHQQALDTYLQKNNNDPGKLALRDVADLNHRVFQTPQMQQEQAAIEQMRQAAGNDENLKAQVAIKQADLDTRSQAAWIHMIDDSPSDGSPLHMSMSNPNAPPGPAAQLVGLQKQIRDLQSKQQRTPQEDQQLNQLQREELPLNDKVQGIAQQHYQKQFADPILKNAPANQESYKALKAKLASGQPLTEQELDQAQQVSQWAKEAGQVAMHNGLFKARGLSTSVQLGQPSDLYTFNDMVKQLGTSKPVLDSAGKQVTRYARDSQGNTVEIPLTQPAGAMGQQIQAQVNAQLIHQLALPTEQAQQVGNTLYNHMDTTTKMLLYGGLSLGVLGMFGGMFGLPGAFISLLGLLGFAGGANQFTKGDFGKVLTGDFWKSLFNFGGKPAPDFKQNINQALDKGRTIPLANLKSTPEFEQLMTEKLPEEAVGPLLARIGPQERPALRQALLSRGANHTVGIIDQIDSMEKARGPVAPGQAAPAANLADFFKQNNIQSDPNTGYPLPSELDKIKSNIPSMSAPVKAEALQKLNEFIVNEKGGWLKVNLGAAMDDNDAKLALQVKQMLSQ